jgi:hypothetical protein
MWATFIILTQKYQKKSYNPGAEGPEPLIPVGYQVNTREFSIHGVLLAGKPGENGGGHLLYFV